MKLFTATEHSYRENKASARRNASSILLNCAMLPRALSVKLTTISIIYGIFTWNLARNIIELYGSTFSMEVFWVLNFPQLFFYFLLHRICNTKFSNSILLSINETCKINNIWINDCFLWTQNEILLLDYLLPNLHDIIK